MKEQRYAIVDLETTGGLSTRDKITEVGIVVFDGSQIVKTYSSLVNPGRSIPTHITRITGIDNDMVADAPAFYEIAKEIVEYTEGCIFVAHNVRFDYGFLKQEFSSLGYTYTKKCLDTVTLSRRTFPGLRSYSLGNLIKHFGLEVSARHRALEDALATTEIFQKILDVQDPASLSSIINRGIKQSKLPAKLSLDKLHELPETHGVYYMYNSYQHVVYIGKSTNIKKRVFQHFAAVTKKAENMSRIVADISYTETGNELAALLLESYEIKKNLPELNKAQRTTKYNYFTHTYYDHHGYICYAYEKSNKKSRANKTILSFYGSKPAALADLAAACRSLELCQSKMDISNSSGSCHAHQMHQCAGACVSKEDPEEYNERAILAADLMKRIFDENFVLLLDGRDSDEKCVVIVENGHYRGYGYVASDVPTEDIEELKESIVYVPVNPEADSIIKTYLTKYPYTKKYAY